MLAMLYLVLISTMALGFFAATEMSAEVAHNDEHIARAFLAAESGMDFMRYQMQAITIPPTVTDLQLMDNVYSQLRTKLVGTGNLGSADVGYDGTTITIPANTASGAPQYIPLDSAAGTSKFRALLKRDGNDVSVTVFGVCSNTSACTRGLQLHYRLQETASPVLKYGVATKGGLKLSGGIVKGIPDGLGTVLSTDTTLASPIQMSGSANISGKVDLVNPAATVSGSGTIGGISNSAMWGSVVTKGVPAPAFPVVDPSKFINYMAGKETLITTNMSLASYSNIRIKGNVSLSGGPTIKGVVLIEAPSQVTFSGGVNIEGVIVVVNPTEGTSTNTITISGGGTLKGPENLPDTYGDLKAMTGSAILAPNYNLVLTGGSASFGGAIVAKSVGLSGGSGGTSTGSVITMGTSLVTWSGGSGFTFNGQTNGVPAGLRFTGSFKPVPESYAEVTN